MDDISISHHKAVGERDADVAGDHDGDTTAHDRQCRAESDASATLGLDRPRRWRSIAAVSGSGPESATILRRLRRHLAWRKQRFDVSVGTQLFIDPWRDPARALYLCSWPRSGSTWLAQIVASAPRTRIVFEPANLGYEDKPSLGTDMISLPLAGPGDDLGAAGALLERAVTGQLRSYWSDQINEARFVERRVIKDIVGVGALPWVAGRWPEMPMVLLLRHPLAVAHSLVSLTWSMNNATTGAQFRAATSPEPDPTLLGEALLREVAQWADDYGWAMSHPACRRSHVIFYETLVADPSSELDRLAEFLRSSSSHWRSWRFDESVVERPSFAAFRRSSASTEEWIDSWSNSYAAGTLEQAAAVIAAAGLSGIYGPGPLPLVDPSIALATVRAARGSREAGE